MTEFKNVDEAINFLHQLPRLHRKNDLTYVKTILNRFNNPQNEIKTIHITGTNGKGSTSYYLNNLLQQAGVKTGLFVSPFITKFNERIQINSEFIPDEDLIQVISEVKKQVEKVQLTDSEFLLTEFEYLVVMAFVYFKRQKVEYAVIEAGIGARHDKTNVIDPLVSIVTSVGMDHEQLIGPTIEDIAYEKSGIIKLNKPIVLGKVDQIPFEIIAKEAESQSATLYRLGENFKIQSEDEQEPENENKNEVNNKFSVVLGQKTYRGFLRRPEVEQYDIAMAIQAFSLLGLSLEEEKVVTTINQTFIPGRYQFVQAEPMIVVDGAHNVQAMTKLTDFVKQINEEHGKIYYLVAMMKDKDIHDVLHLLPSERTTLTTIDYGRSAKVDDFNRQIENGPKFVEDYRVAFNQLYEKVEKDDIIVVTGSFYFVTDFLNYYNSLRGNVNGDAIS